MRKSRINRHVKSMSVLNICLSNFYCLSFRRVDTEIIKGNLSLLHERTLTFFTDPNLTLLIALISQCLPSLIDVEVSRVHCYFFLPNLTP